MRIFLRAFVLVTVLQLPTAAFAAEPPFVKPVPVRPSADADVVVENQEVLEECAPDKVCVQGLLYNAGQKSAENLRLRVEIGGTKLIKPRTSFVRPLEYNALAAGERQEFLLEIDRKLPYKDQGKNKIIEVGKYNFKIVPTWGAPAKSKRKTPLPVRRTKPTNRRP